MALVPLALGMTALASVLLGDYEQAQALAERTARVLPAAVSDRLVQLVLRTRRDSPLFIVLSIGAMVWASAGAVGVVERVTSRLLGRERCGPLLGKVRHLAFGGGVAVAIVLMALAASRTTGLPNRLGLGGRFWGWIVRCWRSPPPCSSARRSTATRRAAGLRGAPRSPARCPPDSACRPSPRCSPSTCRSSPARHPWRSSLVLAGVLFTCYLAALALLLGAALAVRHPRAAPASAAR